MKMLHKKYRKYKTQRKIRAINNTELQKFCTKKPSSLVVNNRKGNTGF